jgi:hypothetical protein
MERRVDPFDTPSKLDAGVTFCEGAAMATLPTAAIIGAGSSRQGFALPVGAAAGREEVTA